VVGQALAAGLSGAKITGAGGGGFLLAICPVEYQRAVRESLSDIRELPIKFDTLGTRIVLNVARDIWDLILVPAEPYRALVVSRPPTRSSYT
jgi:D-glycero-alpha-D-manno-heptose-7-phosphate kinase